MPIISQITHLRGCNIHHTRDVMRAELDLNALDRTFELSPGSHFRQVLDRVLSIGGEKLIDDLQQRLATSEADGATALLVAIIQLDAFLLHQTNVPLPITFAKVAVAPPFQPAVIVWETHDAALSRTAAMAVEKGVAEALGQAGSVEGSCFEKKLEDALISTRHYQLTNGSAVLASAAFRLGIPFERMTSGAEIRLGQGARQVRFYGSVPGFTPLASAKAATDKRLSNRLLVQAALPVPKQIQVRGLADLDVNGGTFSFPLIVKPVYASDAENLPILVTGPDGLQTAFNSIAGAGPIVPMEEEVVSAKSKRKADSGVLIEEHVEGANYQITVVDGRIVAAFLCIPPEVVGDGQRTLLDLAVGKHQASARTSENTQWLQGEPDGDLSLFLRNLGYLRDFVPGAGFRVPLRISKDNGSEGTRIDVTHRIHPDNLHICTQAVRVLELAMARVSFVSPNISLSYRQVGGKIVGISPSPVSAVHRWPIVGAAVKRDIGTCILESIFPTADEAKLPVVVIFGDRGTGRVSRELDRRLRRRGCVVGLYTRKSTLLNGTPLELQHRPGSSRALTALLRQPSVEVIISTISPSRTVARGLSFDVCDVISITSTNGDQEVEGAALGVLGNANRGRFVVDARSPISRQLLALFGHSRVTLVSPQTTSEVQAYLAAGGSAVVGRPTTGGLGLTIELLEGRQILASEFLPDIAKVDQALITAVMHSFALEHRVFPVGGPAIT